jgi:Fic family protein
VNKAYIHRMKSGEYLYVWQNPDWPQWRYNASALVPLVAQVHQALGQLLGRMHDQGISSQSRATLEALTEDVLKTSEIEGEHLNPETVRSSIATRLGVDIGAIAPADRHVDGIVEMILDATRSHSTALTAQRLTEWHAALFPPGQHGLSAILVGTWRNDAQGPMQVVSGPTYKRRVHYEAPPAERLPAEIDDFLLWFETDQELDPLIKAGLAHLWFVTIHPFEDGNGRIARAIGDLALARADQSKQRFYSLSAQIQKERKDYYALLEKTQKGDLEATEWLSWFLACLLRALQEADRVLSSVLGKANFWKRWAGISLNERQIKVLNRMLDGFEGKLNNKKWAAIGKCSSDTALRDINDLLERGILRRSESGGRSTSYVVAI